MHSWQDFFEFVKHNRAQTEARLQAVLQRELEGRADAKQIHHLAQLLIDEFHRLPKGQDTLNDIVDDVAELWMTTYDLDIDDRLQKLPGLVYDVVSELSVGVS